MPAPKHSLNTRRIWGARILIGLVLLSNLRAAIPYLVNPSAYVNSFALIGEPGRTAVFAVGLLFLMWQVPYAFALAQPDNNRRSLIEALLMQSIGLLGELWLRGSISADFAVLRASILRFIIFDGAGLLLLIAAFLLVRKKTTVSQILEE